jgi:hypothetical protein
MCNPGLAMVAVEVAAVAAQTASQAQQASAQASYQRKLGVARNEQIATNAERANKSYVETVTAENLRQAQEQAAASEKIQKIDRDRMRAQSSAKVAAAHANVSGISIDSLLADYYWQEGQYRDAVNQNLDYTKLEAGFRKDAARATAENRIASVQPYEAPPVNSPNYLYAGLKAGVGAATTYKEFKDFSFSPTKGKS